MRVFHDILTSPLGLKRPAVTLGTFDGLHRGHIEILDHLKKLATLGVEGAIVGRAIYTGNIDLKDALRAIYS